MENIIEKNSSKRRKIIYYLTFIFFFIIFILEFNSNRISDEQTHLLLEFTPIILSSIVGIMALVRYYTKKLDSYFYIGMGFIGASIFDGFHIIISSINNVLLFPSSSDSFSGLSFLVSRTYLAIFITVSWLTWKRKWELNEKRVFLISGIIIIFCFYYLTTIELPPVYYPDLLIHRPQDLIPSIFFILALIGILKKGKWKTDSFENWLVISIIIGILGQAVFMPFSEQLFDIMFDWGHILKITSNISVFIGLIINTFQLFKSAVALNIRFSEIIEELRESEAVLKLTDEALDKSDLALELERKQLLTIMNNIEVIIYVSDPNINEIVFVNSHFLEAFCINKNIIHNPIGEKCYKVIHNFDKPCDWCNQYRINREDNINVKWISESDFINRIFQMSSQKIKWSDGRDLRLDVLIDITENLNNQKELEINNRKLERMISDLKQFAFVSSHDLQTPLRTITSFLQLLMNKYPQGSFIDEKALLYIENTIEGAKYLKEIIDSLLIYSNIGTDFKREKIDCEDILDQVILRLSDEIKSSNAKIYRDPLPNIAKGSKEIYLIFHHLIKNAILYNGKNSPKININVNKSKNNDEWLFSISDNGIGIDPKYFNKIFIIFQRLHKKSEYSGLGIGLAICKKIVEMHNGKIWVESKTGKGSTFYFTLPINESDLNTIIISELQ